MKSEIKNTIMVRFSMSVLVLVLVYLFWQEALLSALVGVIACFIPESYQGWKLSKTEHVYEPNEWLKLAYRSMINKWLMTAVIFAVSFSSSVQWDYKILFIGYLVVNVSGVLTPIFFKGKK